METSSVAQVLIEQGIQSAAKAIANDSAQRYPQAITFYNLAVRSLVGDRVGPSGPAAGPGSAPETPGNAGGSAAEPAIDER